MRIIAGRWRGRPLVTPPGLATRPTADRTREALFSMLISRLGSFEGLRVADLYAGSGALGLEALSRGAAQACFIEADRAAGGALRTNVERLGASEAAVVRIADAAALPPLAPPLEPFDLVFADPPYKRGSGSRVVAAVTAAGWLAAGGWLAVETARGEEVQPGELALDKARDIGRARITLLRRQTGPITSSPA